MSRRTRYPSLLAAAVALAAAPHVLGAQERSWRTFDVTRQLHDSTPLLVRLDYQLGRLVVRGAAQPLLYAAHLEYDAARAKPVYDYTPATRTLKLGAEKRGGTTVNDGEAGELRVDLSRRTSLDLQLRLGAVKADLDLGGLRIDHLRVESGASEATVRFDAPNPGRMQALTFDVGAASLSALRLANANADHVTVRAGVGGVELDFGGRWTQDVELTLDMTLGGAVLRVPRDVGLMLETGRSFASVDRSGLVRRGDAWVSENWDTARHKLRIRGRLLVGKLEIERTE